MTIYYLSDCLKTAYRWSQEKRYLERNPVESQLEAVDLFKKIIKGYIGLGAVQGPPGTGKTSVFDLGTREILDEILSSSEKIILLYIAPTNHLVAEAFTRFTANLFHKGLDPQTVLDIVRIYGSKISPCRKSQKEIVIGKRKISCERIKELMKTIDPRNVRFVFTTEYQRISPKIVGKPDEIRFIVDEASKTPFFRVFLPIAKSIIRNPEEFYPKSMIVLGDPQQAITVQEEFKRFKIHLLMKYVEYILNRRGLKEKYYKFLDTTFRLPGPTEVPISKGFYENKLRAFETFYDRYRGLVRGFGLEDILNRAKKAIGRFIDLSKSKNRRIVDAIDEALTTGIPLIVFKTDKFTYGDTFDPRRAYIAYISGLYFSIISMMIYSDKPLFNIGITAPYSDLVYSTGYYLKKRVLEAGYDVKHIIATTVQSIIGGETDVIITMLGKEWLAQPELNLYASYASPLETMYFSEHQVLNVQLSRHRLFMIVIGNLSKLKYSAIKAKRRGRKYPWYKEAGESIEKTVEGFEYLKSIDQLIEKNMISYY